MEHNRTILEIREQFNQELIFCERNMIKIIINLRDDLENRKCKPEKSRDRIILICLRECYKTLYEIIEIKNQHANLQPQLKENKVKERSI